MTITQPLRIFLISILLFIGTSSISQDLSNWTYVSKKLSVEQYRGKPFRYQAKIKTEIHNDSAAARLWARVDNVVGRGFFNNMWQSPIRSSEWKTYTIEGIIDSSAINLTVGTMFFFNGKFYSDDFKVEVATEPNKWQTIFFSDFENDSMPFRLGADKNLPAPNYPWSIIGTTGNKSLLVTGENAPLYGVNNKVGKFAEVNGIRLYYEIYGQGQPLVVLHGNGGGIMSGMEFYTELEKKYKIIAIDSRGQSKSTDTQEPLTYEQMASDINSLLDQLQIDSTLIWGHSDGAILGLILGMKYPKKVKKLLAFGSNIQPDSTAIFQWATDYNLKVLSQNPMEYRKKLTELMLNHPHISFNDIHTIQAPVLIMAGDRDVIRPEHSLKLFQNIPNSQLCILPGSTHGGEWENKNLFLQIMYKFFDSPFSMPDTKTWYVR